jgi:D-sedoheptulose 7-phosphate isomerase
MKHMQQFMQEVVSVASSLDYSLMEDIAAGLANIKTESGRLFILGVGGSAANAAHAVNDFRKLCGIEAYAPTDNVSELTARTNDEGWETVFSGWLKVSKLSNKDALLILSVGGGNAEHGVSVNLVHAIDAAKAVGAKIFGIVGRDGGYTKKMGDMVILVPIVNNDRVTPHAEAFQAVIWHGLVSHPVLQIQSTKW